MIGIVSIPPPIYYLGYVIQRTPLGIFVYSREDTRNPCLDWRFDSLECAKTFIEEKVRWMR